MGCYAIRHARVALSLVLKNFVSIECHAVLHARVAKREAASLICLKGPFERLRQ